MKKRILIWELIGIIFIIGAGTLLHFAYEWLGHWKPAALVAAVNESVWEHLKMAFWPALIFYIVEWFFIHRTAKNYFFAKAVALWLMPAAIIALFYGYTAILGHNLLALDISTFVIAVIVGQLVSYKLLTAKRTYHVLNIIGIFAILILLAMFSIFTYYPPELQLFKDPNSGVYGIP